MLFCLSLWPVYRPWTLQLQCSFSSSCVTVPKPSMKATRMLTEGTEQIRSALLYLECQQSFPMTSWKVFLPREKWSWFSPDPSKKKAPADDALSDSFARSSITCSHTFLFSGVNGRTKIAADTVPRKIHLRKLYGIFGCTWADFCKGNHLFSMRPKWHFFGRREKNEGPVLTNIDVKTIFLG